MQPGTAAMLLNAKNLSAIHFNMLLKPQVLRCRLTMLGDMLVNAPASPLRFGSSTDTVACQCIDPKPWNPTPKTLKAQTLGQNP